MADLLISIAPLMSFIPIIHHDPGSAFHAHLRTTKMFVLQYPASDHRYQAHRRFLRRTQPQAEPVHSRYLTRRHMQRFTSDCKLPTCPQHRRFRIQRSTSARTRHTSPFDAAESPRGTPPHRTAPARANTPHLHPLRQDNRRMTAHRIRRQPFRSTHRPT